jgi:hypothetical protein
LAGGGLFALIGGSNIFPAGNDATVDRGQVIGDGAVEAIGLTADHAGAKLV